jgi:DNA-binding CsgD family transcriptional regulator
LRGEAGIGKSALLEYAVASAGDMRVASVAAVESEMELSFAGLHQVLVPFLGGLERLPVPQRDALGSAFGLVSGLAPDRLLLGLAALTLVTDAAMEQPALYVIDDAQWLDKASIAVLGFVARRVFADRVGMLFAVREGEDRLVVLEGLSEIRIDGLPDDAAGELLSISVGSQLDQGVARRIVSETAGNPLALVELGGVLTARGLSSMAVLGEPLRLGARLEELFLSRARALPAATQELLLVAAADPSGEAARLWDAAERLGIKREAAEIPELERLLTLRPSVRFRHPLMRSAVYHGASAASRRRVHKALADAGDPALDPDRRAWHLAAAAPGPDEEVARELERSAARAQARGALAAAAAFLQRSVALTRAPARRVERTLAASQASLQAGAFDAALELVDAAEVGQLDELQRARIDLLRGQIAYASRMTGDAVPLLLKAGKRFESLDVDLARETYLRAFSAAAFGDRAPSTALPDVCRAARALPPLTEPPRTADLVLDGLALLITEGRSAAAPTMQRAASLFASADLPIEDALRWGWVATTGRYAMWDNDGARAICTWQLQLFRDAGALEGLTFVLVALSFATVRSGDFAAGASLMAELDEVTAATGGTIPSRAGILLLSLQGRQAEASALIDAELTADSEQGTGGIIARWARAILYNGLGRYEEAMAAARQASADPLDMYPSMWALPELVEAATRCGQTELAANALVRLAKTTRPGGTELGLGIEARSRALVSEGEVAEGLYREAIDRLGRTGERTELARAHLLYGEWLRRENRRIDARRQLRLAYDMLGAIGMEAFAERARRELLATGERVRKRAVGTRDDLTAQEGQIARLAGDGLSNSEIGVRLYISAHTVAYHLRKVFRKLGIDSRGQLARALAEQT